MATTWSSFLHCIFVILIKMNPIDELAFKFIDEYNTDKARRTKGVLRQVRANLLTCMKAQQTTALCFKDKTCLVIINQRGERVVTTEHVAVALDDITLEMLKATQRRLITRARKRGLSVAAQCTMCNVFVTCMKDALRPLVCRMSEIVTTAKRPRKRDVVHRVCDRPITMLAMPSVRQSNTSSTPRSDTRRPDTPRPHTQTKRTHEESTALTSSPQPSPVSRPNVEHAQDNTVPSVKRRRVASDDDDVDMITDVPTAPNSEWLQEIVASISSEEADTDNDSEDDHTGSEADSELASSCFDDEECVEKSPSPKKGYKKTRWTVAATARILLVVMQSLLDSQAFGISAANQALSLKGEIIIGFQDERAAVCEKEAELAMLARQLEE